MVSQSNIFRPIPIYWNNVDGRLETFYKSYQSDMSNFALISINSFKVIKYLRKQYLGNLGYLSGGKKGDYINYIKENVIYDLRDEKLQEFWELVAFITPYNYENITINEPMRRIINIGEYFEYLTHNTLKEKFNYFKKISSLKNKNINLPDDIIDLIGSHCGVVSPYFTLSI